MRCLWLLVLLIPFKLLATASGTAYFHFDRACTNDEQCASTEICSYLSKDGGGLCYQDQDLNYPMLSENEDFISCDILHPASTCGTTGICAGQCVPRPTLSIGTDITPADPTHPEETRPTINPFSYLPYIPPGTTTPIIFP